MLLHKLWRTMRLYRAQFLSMIIMTALGVGVFVGFNMEWVSIEDSTSAFFEQTGYADYRIVSEAGFSEEELARIRAIDGVDAAARFLSVNAGVSEREGDTLALTVTTDEAVSGMLLCEGEPYDPQSADGLWLSSQYAGKNDLHIGDSLTLTYQSLVLKTTVRGLIKAGEYMVCVRDESQLMPDFSTYGFAYISPKLYETMLSYYPQINVRSSMEKKAFIDAADAALDRTVLVLTKDESAAYAGAKSETEEGKTMGSVLPPIFLLIAVLTMVTTMHRLALKEKTQIGTLKALGFRDRRILRHYTAYAFLTGLIGSALGIALGCGIAWAIMNPNGMMGTYFDLLEWKLSFPWFCGVIVAAVLALMTLTGYLSVRRILKETPAEALRPDAPKKFRPLLIERTRLFHRLPFGTRWNLRDVMRHKARTAMSLIGTASCALIITAALGMSDTMDAFLDTYYEDAAGYASRIYLSDELTQPEREALAQEHNADWSASISVQLEEKAVSLEIYSLEHGLIRFPEDEGTGYVTPGGEGAYLCRRLSEEFGLQEGDSFTVSPYGSDEHYTLRVAGVVRSLTESIVLSKDYADALGIPYAASFLYTAEKPAEIASGSAIRSVQSKQQILDSFDSFMEIMDLMIFVLILGAMLLDVVVLYNLGVMSYTERYREMATLKVVGFRNRRIGRLLTEQNLWISILGVVIGLPLGVLVMDYMLKALASEYELAMVIRPLSFAVSVALTLGMSLLVSLMVARKNRKIDMVEALKGAE